MVTLNTLVSFDGSDGDGPSSGLMADGVGDLLGTTGGGGTSSDGTVFEIAKTADGYASSPTTLLSFDGDDGAYPTGGLIADGAGDLFGTARFSGPDGGGTVFEIAETAEGYASAPTILVSFSGAEGYGPIDGLIADTAGDLFGTTLNGGPLGPLNGSGTVFEIAETAGGYASVPTTLINLDAQSFSGLFADGAGDLFYTTDFDGTNKDGAAFEIAKTADGYASTATTLASFNFGVSGEGPEGLKADAAGNLFGTTVEGGPNFDDAGTVFEIAKTADGYAGAPTPLVYFTGDDGGTPLGSLIVDAAGNLFGTTSTGGTSSDGTVFEIAKTADGYASAPTVLVNFNGANGAKPETGLMADAAGNLFGTTSAGGANGDGSAFEITDSGFVVACYLCATRIATPAGERTVESLVAGNRVTTASGAARPIKWIGHRSICARLHPRPEDVWPMRVVAGAFGDGLPHRDLFLSPDHAVFIDGVFIPIRYLVNGRTIRQEPRDAVSYWHVELGRHDVLLAEGLPCESYLDTGNRGTFENGGPVVQMHPDFALHVWDTKACAPLVRDGVKLHSARKRLLECAEALGFATTLDPALRMLAGGQVVMPKVAGRLHRFSLPATACVARLLTRSAMPAHVRPDSSDHRHLGVAISRIIVDGRTIALDDACLSSGWHEIELDSTGDGWRWTDGDAGLALAGARTLEIEIAIAERYWLDDHSAEVRLTEAAVTAA